MNADEFGSELQRLRGIRDEMVSQMGWVQGSFLNTIIEKLEEHRLEIKEAEHKPVSCGQLRDAELRTPTHGSTSECDTVSQSQLDAIQKRCDDLAGRLKRLENERMPGHHRRIDAIEKRLGEIARAVDTLALYEAACIPPASG